MPSKKFEKGSEQWLFFMDYWKFVQEYAEPDKSDEFWQNVVDKSDILCKKYGNKQYVRDLVMAHINELERMERGKR